MARRHGRTTCLFVLAGLVVALALAAPASASTPNKPYLVTISPGLTAGGQNVTITATFKNMTGQQQIGSANLFWPTGVFPGGPTADPTTNAPPVQLSQPGTWTLSNSCTFGTSTGPCIQLRNLSLLPGNTLVVTITAATPACSPAAGAWSVEAKQSNNFSGPPGNDLTLTSSTQQLTSTLDGACKLAWNPPPADSLTYDPINAPLNFLTSNQFTPGSPVSVNVVQSDGKTLATGLVNQVQGPAVTVTPQSNPGAVTLGGTVREVASGGIASFGDLTINRPGDGYTLSASSSPSLTPGLSNAFNVVDKAVSCPANASCSTTDGNGNGNGQVLANATGSGGNDLLLSVNSNNSNTLAACGSYVSADQNVYEFDGPADRSKVGRITITNPNSSSPALKGSKQQILSAQQICFDGLGFTGLLPTCQSGGDDPDNRDDPDGDSDDTIGPCHNRQQDKIVADPSSPLGIDIVLVADIPAGFGDPHMS